MGLILYGIMMGAALLIAYIFYYLMGVYVSHQNKKNVEDVKDSPKGCGARSPGGLICGGKHKWFCNKCFPEDVQSVPKEEGK